MPPPRSTSRLGELQVDRCEESMDKTLQDRLHEARTRLMNGNAPIAEKLYRAELTPALAPADRMLALDGLGRCLHIQGRLEEAEDVFRESLCLLREQFGPKSAPVAAGLQNLARLRSERG
ncbi:MAG: tetratricopeptide repeat protein, partial [Bilophila sp.]